MTNQISGTARSQKNRPVFLLLGFLMNLALVAGAPPAPAEAGLGDLRPEVMAKAQSLGLSLVRTDQREGYTALTFSHSESRTLPGRPPRTLIVREFLDSAGRSFAVAWKGSLHPDLSLLLGELSGHLPPVNRSSTRHRLFFQDGRLVISVLGTSLFQSGAAWDKTRLPPGVSPARIRIAP